MPFLAYLWTVLFIYSAKAALPSQVLDLSNWELQLPTGPQGNPDEVTQPRLASYSNQPYFYAPDSSSVLFSAFVNGSHTGGSEYPRTELRERNGSSDASWSTTQGSHVMTLREAYTHLPAKRPEVVGAQILSKNGMVLQVRLNSPRIVVYGPSGNPAIDANYQLGTIFSLQIEVAAGVIKVYYNGDLKITWEHSATDCYFKAGAYVQSNLNYDSPSQYGETKIYSLSVKHTD